MGMSLADLAAETGTELVGDGTCVIDTVADIETAQTGSISFVSDRRYIQFIESTSASALIITADLKDDFGIPALISDDPRLTYARVANLLFPSPTYEPHVSDEASIASSAVIADGCRIEPGAVIAEGVEIGEMTMIGANVVIEAGAKVGSRSVIRANSVVGRDCEVGDDSILHSGSVLGADGFGYVRDGDENIKIPQTGRVVVGDHVEIGACTTIDRGALEDTIIADGVKIDNQIQIGHSVRIGENTIISAATAIAGSTVIGANCMIGGCVAIREHLNIADRVMITGRTLVTHSINEEGACVSSGTPMDDTASWRKNSARFRQLDKLARRLAAIEKSLSDGDE